MDQNQPTCILSKVLWNLATCIDLHVVYDAFVQSTIAEYLPQTACGLQIQKYLPSCPFLKVCQLLT